MQPSNRYIWWCQVLYASKLKALVYSRRVYYPDIFQGGYFPQGLGFQKCRYRNKCLLIICVNTYGSGKFEKKGEFFSQLLDDIANVDWSEFNESVQEVQPSTSKIASEEDDDDNKENKQSNKKFSRQSVINDLLF